MPAEPQMTIEIDLRDARASAERTGELDAHAIQAAEISRDIRSLVEVSADQHHPKVMVTPMPSSEPASKSGHQIIEIITLFVGSSIGVRGALNLVAKILDKCRTKIPTILEVEIPGKIKIKLSGSELNPDDRRLLQQHLTESRSTPITGRAPHAPAVRIKVLPKATTKRKR